MLCFLAGNDFLPHLPWIFIKDGHIGDLLDVYYATAAKRGGHFIDGKTGAINMRHVLTFFADLKQLEEVEFFTMIERISREEAQQRYLHRAKSINAPKKVFSAELRRLANSESGVQSYFDDKLKKLKEKTGYENFPRNKVFPIEVQARAPGWNSEVNGF